ncbi:MAG TPA: PAS domain S-box protein, partial [Sphingobacteriaceae bacterium]
MIHPQDFALLFKATPAPYLILRPDAPHFTICEVNDAYCRATGSTREELLGKGIFDAFPHNLSDPSSNDLKSLKNSLLRVVAFRTEHRMNLRKHAVPFRGSKEFQERYWSQVNYPVLDDHGSVMYIIHSLTDVTGQVPAGKKEKRIRLRPIENQEHYRSLFDHNPDTVYSFDLDGLFHHNALPMWVYDLKNYRFLEVNLAATEIYGYTREEFLQMTVLDIRPAEDAELIRTAATARTACRTQYKGYWRHVKKDKGLIYVDITSHLIEYNGIQASLILAQDVTQKILAKEASRKSEEVRTLIMNSALDAIACMDTRGMITLWNDQAEKIFGWKREELLGRRLSEYVIAEGCRATHDDGLKRYLEHGQGDFINQVVEVTGVDKKGIEFPIELTIVHIKQRESQFF